MAKTGLNRTVQFPTMPFLTSVWWESVKIIRYNSIQAMLVNYAG